MLKRLVTKYIYIYIEREAKLGIKGGKNQGSTPRENAGGMLTMYREKSTYL